MITVRLPNGMTVRYNEATYLLRETLSWILYSKDPKMGGVWIASIQVNAGVIVEAVQPCLVTAPPVATVKNALELIVEELNRKQITGWNEECLLADLKAKLQRFDARKKIWK